MYLLFIFTMVAAGSSGREYSDWRYQAEFTSETKCIQAVKRMQIPENKFICTAK